MKVRDCHARLNGVKDETEMPSGGLQIIADNGDTLYEVYLNDDGSLRVSVNGVCKHGGVLLDDRPLIRLKAANCFEVFRPKYDA
jgi:hypothetical protein